MLKLLQQIKVKKSFQYTVLGVEPHDLQNMYQSYSKTTRPGRPPKW